MINYDVVVIGGGVAGYTSALRFLEQGLKTAVVSHGQSAMHFSSGSIDVLSHSPVDGKAVRAPFDEIDRLTQQMPEHPYSKIGRASVLESLQWFKQFVGNHGLPMNHNQSLENHYRITSLGSLKATWLSQPYVFSLDFDYAAVSSIKRIVLVSVEGFRDFQPEIAKAKLASMPELEGVEVRVVKVRLDAAGLETRNCHEFRSIDVSRLLRQPQHFSQFCSQLRNVATPNDLVILPSLLGNGDGLTLMDKLAQETHLRFHEVPTMPPSLLGIRVEDTLRRAFIEAGGTLHVGDEVTSGVFRPSGEQLSLACIYTKKLKAVPINAGYFVLATGSFFSKGLVAGLNKVTEPIFDLDIATQGSRDQWYSERFFSQSSHPFLSFGVETNQHFQPTKAGRTLENLYCAGSILPHYDPIAHGSGGGVAISTGYIVAEHVIAKSSLNTIPKAISEQRKGEMA